MLVTHYKHSEKGQKLGNQLTFTQTKKGIIYNKYEEVYTIFDGFGYVLRIM